MAAGHGERLPTGTLTFLFTDIEGSTRLLSSLGTRYQPLLEAHARILRKAIVDHEGTEVSTEGDAFFAVFPSAPRALAAAAAAQRALSKASWPNGADVRVRMGLHTGEGRRGGDNYVGMDVHRAARIAAAGHGGQILLSDATHGLVAQGLPADMSLRDMGQHWLKDLAAPEHVWQLDVVGLPSRFGALKSTGTPPSNLPHVATSLIGRERELGALVDLLAERRLLTLTGPGGAGKTRLAIAAAERCLARFRDGASFVALENATDAAGLRSAIANALGVREKRDRDVAQGVRAFLRDRELLLVLDNFEQLIDAAPLVAQLISEARGLRVLVTSRSPLRLSDEQDFPVPPLTIPDPAHLPAPDALSQYEAVALFIARATAVQPGFRITNENAPAIAEICSRLDGLPLAIELAAARIRLLPPDAILDRLERRLDLLTGGARDLPDRQRTLRGTIDWSYELLTPAERRLFDRLAAFAGGWTLESAEAVCNPAGELGLDLLDGMSSLVDKSLVRPMDVSGGEARFTMLQVLREFAGEHLDASPDGDSVRRRQALEMANLVETAEPELVRTQIRKWQHRLRREEDNIRVALKWAVDHGDAEIGLRVAGGLWHFWGYWLQVREGRAWLERTLALPGADAVEAPRARALDSLAALEYWQGDGDSAAEHYRQALEIWRAVRNRARIGETLHNLAWASVARNDFPSAQAYARQAIEAYAEARDDTGRANVEAWLRTSAYFMGQLETFDDAVAAAQEAAAANRRVGRLYDAADWTTSLAMLYWRAGDLVRARPTAIDAVRLWRDIGDVGRMGTIKLVAALELRSGNPERAVVLGGAAERHRDEVGGELPEHMMQGGDPVEGARASMPAELHARLLAEGMSMTPEEAADLVLQDAPPATSEVAANS